MRYTICSRSLTNKSLVRSKNSVILKDRILGTILLPFATGSSDIIKGVSSFQGWICTIKHSLGHFKAFVQECPHIKQGPVHDFIPGRVISNLRNCIP